MVGVDNSTLTFLSEQMHVSTIFLNHHRLDLEVDFGKAFGIKNLSLMNVTQYVAECCSISVLKGSSDSILVQ